MPARLKAQLLEREGEELRLAQKRAGGDHLSFLVLIKGYERGSEGQSRALTVAFTNLLPNLFPRAFALAVDLAMRSAEGLGRGFREGLAASARLVRGLNDIAFWRYRNSGPAAAGFRNRGSRRDTATA